MNIRTYRPGDESAQAAIYNEAAALPHFKPATVQEVQRRSRARDFDPAMRFFAEENGQAVGYCQYHATGRVSFPWFRKGREQQAAALFAHMLEAMKQRGLKRAFAAYRADWNPVNDFFLQQGFRKIRDMVNYVIDLVDMPTPPARPSSSITPLQKGDIPALLALGAGILQITEPGEIEKYLFHNQRFPPEAFFVLRSRTGGALIAVGILVTEPTYANPKAVDAGMPCYRLGAFGSEGMNTKRINGLFSFVVRPDQNVGALGLDLMGHAAYCLRETDDLDALASQVPSDAPALLPFYERNFRRQGSFPVFEKML